MKTIKGISTIIKNNIAVCLQHNASYVDVRFFPEDKEENLVFYDGSLDTNYTIFQSGIGVRVLYKGAWGFAAASSMSDIDDCFKQASQNARIASKLLHKPLFMGNAEPVQGRYMSPVVTCPFATPLNKKLDFLKEIDRSLREEWILRRIVSIQCQKKHSCFWNSEGVEIEKCLYNVFGTISIMALDIDGQMQLRSQTLYTTGEGSRGWELIEKPELFSNHTDRIKAELKQLISSEELKQGKRSVILLPGQGFVQVHETIGHALELDRILGYELSYAGGSFVTLDSIGTLRYGTEKLNANVYGGIENSPGTIGYDDEGTPQKNYMIIDRGILVNALTSRAMINEANKNAEKAVFKESGACSRSEAFYRPPIDRMTNVNILPGDDGTLDDIIASTEDGIILDNPRSWSIGSNREHFHFGCEISWEVKNGTITRVLRNPSYQGHTLEFYNSLVAVGDESTWRVEQVNKCGKGEPNQKMQLGHGIPVLKFDNVVTGE